MSALPFSREEFSEYYLDLRKSILLLDDFTSHYNQDRPLRQQLRASHRALMHEVLRIYRIFLWKEQSYGMLLIPGTPLPYLSTNNVQLAKKVRCSSRTIQNLRQRLQEAGLIIDEVWHGSKANYELRINPRVIFLGQPGDRRNWISLFEREQPKTAAPELRTSKANGWWKTAAEPVEIAATRPAEQDANQPPYEEKKAVFAENFSSICTLSLQDTNQLNQLEIDPCGKGAGADEDRSGDRRRNFLTGYETDSDEYPPLSLRDISPDGEIPPRVARRPPVGEREIGRKGDGETGKWGYGEALPQTFGEVVAQLPEKLGRRIFREVSKVWEVAQEELYAGEWIADSERERAKTRLAEYYIYADPKRYEAGTAEICERIRLVRKWIDRGRQSGQERWVPIPSVYFDYRNKRGFGRTKAWYKKHIAKRQEIGDKIAVARAVGRYRKCLAAGPGPEGPMEVYRQLKDKLRERGKGVMLRFQNAVIHE